MEIFIIIIFLLPLVYIFNALYSMSLAQKKCKENLDEGNYGRVNEVYDFYYKDWFGFKHWFVKYEEKVINE